jgi:hypothetical protein
MSIRKEQQNKIRICKKYNVFYFQYVIYLTEVQEFEKCVYSYQTCLSNGQHLLSAYCVITACRKDLSMHFSRVYKPVNITE